VGCVCRLVRLPQERASSDGTLVRSKKQEAVAARGRSRFRCIEGESGTAGAVYENRSKLLLVRCSSRI
jgi:hypothetical protein